MKDDLSGILIVDKEKNMTSHDVVQFVRRKFSIKKVGHAGTLDPNATGVLVLLLGDATKLSAGLIMDEKEYEAVMKLGEKTDSGDCRGKIVRKIDVNISADVIRKIFLEFTGEIEQVPPMVSAKSVGGKRLYKLALKGIEVERKAQKIFIKKLEIKKIELPYISFDVICSKGTYIRQLADDIGERLGSGGHLTELRRTRSGRFSIDRSISFEKLHGMDRQELGENILRI
ncbi:MAG: tRNA pseudouridine(55) synthase TruB [Candidatus Omnitrophica bacterium]|nr:tRNA pseudouridine(55) synthase TruB [Candidatus Omnitrophota bacterium]